MTHLTGFVPRDAQEPTQNPTCPVCLGMVEESGDLHAECVGKVPPLILRSMKEGTPLLIQLESRQAIHCKRAAICGDYVTCEAARIGGDDVLFAELNIVLKDIAWVAEVAQGDEKKG